MQQFNDNRSRQGRRLAMLGLSTFVGLVALVVWLIIGQQSSAAVSMRSADMTSVALKSESYMQPIGHMHQDGRPITLIDNLPACKAELGALVYEFSTSDGERYIGYVPLEQREHPVVGLCTTDDVFKWSSAT